jgi:hypothetical protein
MRKRKNRLSLYVAVQPHEQGRLPNYDLHLQRPTILNGAGLTPSITAMQERNCRTINRLQSALARIRAVNKIRLSV